MLSWVIETDTQEELEEKLQEIKESEVLWNHKTEVLPDGRRICYVNTWTEDEQS